MGRREAALDACAPACLHPPTHQSLALRPLHPCPTPAPLLPPPPCPAPPPPPGVRLLRTNLTEADVGPRRETLAQMMFDHIPVGVGGQGLINVTADDLEDVLRMGIDWSLREASLPASTRGGASRAWGGGGLESAVAPASASGGAWRSYQAANSLPPPPPPPPHPPTPSARGTPGWRISSTARSRGACRAPTRPRCRSAPSSAGCRRWARWGRATTMPRSRLWRRCMMPRQRAAWALTAWGR